MSNLGFHLVDNLSKEQRSFTMSRIRSKWTKPELLVHNHLKGWKIRHKMHPKIEGHPDLILLDKLQAVFIHGCFWHKCALCYRPPKSHRDYWQKKITQNIARDKKNVMNLRKKGWKVICIWEHELKQDLEHSLQKILR